MSPIEKMIRINFCQLEKPSEIKPPLCNVGSGFSIYYRDGERVKNMVEKSSSNMVLSVPVSVYVSINISKCLQKKTRKNRHFLSKNVQTFYSDRNSVRTGHLVNHPIILIIISIRYF